MQIETDCRYANYVKRQEADIAAMRKDDALEIPEDTDFSKIGGLSNESVELFNRFRPSSIGQANRVPGINTCGRGMCFAIYPTNPKRTRTISKNRFFCTIAISNMMNSFSVLKNKYNVSRETFSQLITYHDLLIKWQKG